MRILCIHLAVLFNTVWNRDTTNLQYAQTIQMKSKRLPQMIPWTNPMVHEDFSYSLQLFSRLLFDATMEEIFFSPLSHVILSHTTVIKYV